MKNWIKTPANTFTFMKHCHYFKKNNEKWMIVGFCQWFAKKKKCFLKTLQTQKIINFSLLVATIAYNWHEKSSLIKWLNDEIDGKSIKNLRAHKNIRVNKWFHANNCTRQINHFSGFGRDFSAFWFHEFMLSAKNVIGDTCWIFKGWLDFLTAQKLKDTLWYCRLDYC